MNDLIKKMQKVVNVIKVFIVFMILHNNISCGSTRKDIVDHTYKIEKYKSKKTGFSSITINAFDYETQKKLAGIVYINSLVFFMKFNKEEEVVPLKINPESEKFFDIEVSYIRRHTVKVKKFYVKRGDSIVINAYLKEDKRPLH